MPAIRTYKYDAAENIESSNLSQIGIAAAEQNRRARNNDFSSLQRNNTPIGTNIIYIVISVVLVVTGIWGAFFFYNRNQIENDPALTPNQGILLFTNDEIELVLERSTGAEIMRTLDARKESENIASSEIVEFTLIEDTLLGNRKMSAQSFLSRLSGVPRNLIRTMEDDFLFGLHGESQNEPILIFKVEDFDTAFAGMLDWEFTMSESLSPVFGTVPSKEFEDVILRNKDTRMLRDSGGNPAIIYAFPNAETILITTNEDTFFEIFERLTASNATRS